MRDSDTVERGTGCGIWGGALLGLLQLIELPIVILLQLH